MSVLGSLAPAPEIDRVHSVSFHALISTLAIWPRITSHRLGSLGLTRFREPIRVKLSSSVKGVEIDGKERKALLA
jgi:hypothetical protein